MRASSSLSLLLLAGSYLSPWAVVVPFFFVGAFSFNPNSSPPPQQLPPFPASAPGGPGGPPPPPSQAADPAGSGRYDDTRPAPGMSGVARPPPLASRQDDSSGVSPMPPSGGSGSRTASSIGHPLVRSARGTGNDPVVGGADGTWWEAAGHAGYATRGQQGNFQTFTDQQRSMSRNEPQEAPMPRRTRTESGYAPGTQEGPTSSAVPRRSRTESGYAPGSQGPASPDNMSRRTRTESGYAPGSPEQRAAAAGQGDGGANSWWDSTGRSRDDSHGTQGNFQTFTDQQRKSSRLREDERGHSPEYRYYWPDKTMNGGGAGAHASFGDKAIANASYMRERGGNGANGSSAENGNGDGGLGGSGGGGGGGIPPDDGSAVDDDGFVAIQGG